MPFYDFYCKVCHILNEDEFFKIADEKNVECIECGKQMEQVILKAPGLSDPAGIGQKWTNDGYQMRDEKTQELRIVTEKWDKGKNVIRSDVHKDDPSTGYKPKFKTEGVALKKMMQNRPVPVGKLRPLKTVDGSSKKK